MTLRAELQHARGFFEQFLGAQTLWAIHSPLASVMLAGPATDLRELLAPVDSCLWNLFELSYVLDWALTRNQFTDEILRKHVVKSFHVEMQSAFDYLCEAIVDITGSRGMNNRATFFNLRNWCQLQPIAAENELGPALQGAIAGCTWFDQINTIRNAVVHRGSNIVTAQAATFHVQFDGNNYPVVAWLDPRLFTNIDVSMTNYFAAYLARLLNLLDSLVPIISIPAGVTIDQPYSGDVPAGSTSVCRWIDQTIALLP